MSKTVNVQTRHVLRWFTRVARMDQVIKECCPGGRLCTLTLTSLERVSGRRTHFKSTPLSQVYLSAASAAAAPSPVAQAATAAAPAVEDAAKQHVPSATAETAGGDRQVPPACAAAAAADRQAPAGGRHMPGAPEPLPSQASTVVYGAGSTQLPCTHGHEAGPSSPQVSASCIPSHVRSSCDAPP